MEKVFASVITIGDELLIGQVIDTNSAWIAQELNKQGILVKHRVAVGDVWQDIWDALDAEQQHADIILITGGLGPTADDITKPLLCEYFGGKMVLHQPTLDHVTLIFEKILKRPMIERNRKQAEVPDTCTVLLNEKGTAPGMLFEKNGKVFISMPGVPHEMKWIMQQHVLPLLQGKYQSGFVAHRTLLTAGVGESFLAERIKDVEAILPAELKLAYLPNYGMVRLRLTGWSTNKLELNKLIDYHFQQLKDSVQDILITDEDEPVEVVIGKLLKAKGQTVSTAESCTGGYIAHLLTSVAGSSDYYMGSVVSYAYDLKEQLLGVDHAEMAQHGAVSEKVVTQMVKGALANMKTDYAVAVSGIMGPGGGLPDKPVGTVWMAVGSKEKLMAKKMQFRFDRKRNIELTATQALLFLRELIVDKT
jgi:nicotinamide-nucleotide amidase